MDKISDIMGRWHRHREIEVFLTTLEGAQHLRLHSWLKKNDILIKSENIVNQDDYFGVFTIYVDEIMLDKIKDENAKKDLFGDLEVISIEEEKWKTRKEIRNDENLFENIQNFMLSFRIRDKDEIDKFLAEANETSLALFKKNKDFIKDYVETPEMSPRDKIKDLNLMIETFIEEERYEDCALLVKIKDKVKKYYKQQKIKENE